MVVDQKAVNRWAARVVPAFIIAVFVYAAYVVVAQVCVNSLLRPPTGSARPARPGAAIATLVIFFLLFLLALCTYGRLLYTVSTNPGYVERGPGWAPESTAKGPSEKRSSDGQQERPAPETARGGGEQEAQYPVGQPYADVAGGRPTVGSKQPDLHDFYTRDAFLCEPDGRPAWCSVCMNWKPDRAHHCREVGRCVRKMDHFCPWVGGVVSETSFKFFIQFTAWSAMLSIFIVAILASSIAELRFDGLGANAYMAVLLGLTVFFGIFAFTMCGVSLKLALDNVTTIESLTQTLKTVQYPLPARARTFAILNTEAGDNPYHLGALNNLRSVMGHSLLDWILPLRYSPCCDHSSGRSQFALGPAFERMLKRAGITDTPMDDGSGGSIEATAQTGFSGAV